MTPDYTVVIPARYASTRLPGKPLVDIAGQTMIERVWRQAGASGARRVVVATDDQRIVNAVSAFGGESVLTRPDHESGTDRLQEVAAQLVLADDALIVNVQGDEPLIPPAVIDQVARNLAASGAGVATLSEPIVTAKQFFDPNLVKVVTGSDGTALYFSRAPIPWVRDHFQSDQLQQSLSEDREQNSLPEGFSPQRHIGIYGYRVGELNRFVTWPPAPLEQLERLEQLRFMWHGVAIHVEPACEPVPGGVDTPEDLERLRRQLAG